MDDITRESSGLPSEPQEGVSRPVLDRAVDSEAGLDDLVHGRRMEPFDRLAGLVQDAEEPRVSSDAMPEPDPEPRPRILPGSGGDGTPEPAGADAGEEPGMAAPGTIEAEAEVEAEPDEVPTVGEHEALEAAPPIHDAAHMGRVLLALLLASRETLSFLRIAQVCDTSQAMVRDGVAWLQGELQNQHLPLELLVTDTSVKALTAPAVFPYLQRLRGIRRAEKLTQAALETLAVIAYRQPVLRAEIEAIRGVKAGPMLRTLLDHKLVKVVGRADVPGRPLQYGTTQHFLERFGLASLKDLPSLKEFKQLD